MNTEGQRVQGMVWLLVAVAFTVVDETSGSKKALAPRYYFIPKCYITHR
ncbi:MAG: hypothetical protein R3351_02945 [Nitrospirales bacterium]|nr:hypothetical protein [Nitrospirales bacterium]